MLKKLCKFVSDTRCGYIISKNFNSWKRNEITKFKIASWMLGVIRYALSSTPNWKIEAYQGGIIWSATPSRKWCFNVLGSSIKATGFLNSFSFGGNVDEETNGHQNGNQLNHSKIQDTKNPHDTLNLLSISTYLHSLRN